MLITLNDVALEKVAVAVSEKRVSVASRCADFLSEKRAKRMVKGTGFKKLSIAADNIYTSDFCIAAANYLFSNGIDKKQIGAIIYITQSPEYPAPATSFFIQDKLKLSKNTMCFDVNLGCSGFVYGVYLSAVILSSLSQNEKVLLLCGDALSNNVYPKDTSSLAITGDAGSAAIIGHSPKKKMFFNLESFGEKAKVLYAPRGGTRAHLITDETGKLSDVRDNYSIMDGMGIMNFTLNDVPLNIKELATYAGISLSNIGMFFFHQANRIVVESLADSLNIAIDKAPFCNGEIGNTASSTIPVCMSEMKRLGESIKPGYSLLSGFGIGLSIASAIMDLSNLDVLATGEI